VLVGWACLGTCGANICYARRMAKSSWLEQIKSPQRWRARLLVFVVLLVVIAFTFLVSFPLLLGFGNTNPMIIVTNAFAAFVSAWLFGERLRVTIERSGGASFLWAGPMYTGFAAIGTAVLGMLLYWLTQQLEESPRDGNPWFGGFLLLALYLPLSFIGGVFGGFFIWRNARNRRVF
jgi:hypothetical protein